MISAEGLPRILEHSSGYAAGYLTLCIRALHSAVASILGVLQRKVVGLLAKFFSTESLLLRAEMETRPGERKRLIVFDRFWHDLKKR